MRNLRTCILIFLILTVITGVIYPLLVTFVAQTAFPDKANGSLVRVDGDIRGSILIGQKFTGSGYFWPRPSMTDYGTLPSSASNLGPTSEALKEMVEDRRDQLAPYISGKIPADLLLASGSGLDPHISPEAARAQIDHVARARNLSDRQITALKDLVRQYTEPAQWGIFGAPRINVLKLNMAVDDLFGKALYEGVDQR